MTQDQPVRRQRHLIDPDNPRPRTSPEDLARLERVQKWVLSVLIVTTILHLSAGLGIAAQYVDEGATTAGVGLSALAGAFGVIAVASGRAIHRKPIASLWLLLGVIPGLVSLFLFLS